ncbi:uncharacterized protein BJ171DRAFT_406041, partial [Polychytrium aggregatum]|uniref:uncharacterized protein n=1 Tax=Polychytrium aggregatum TaxID=110093 RepID=UPI0022FECD5F
LGGQTLHSFTSISPGMPNDPKVISQYIRQSPWRMNKYANTNILIMDESSMVDPMYFNLFQQVFSTLHNKRRGSRQRSDSHKPFSSLQIIITGDFFQLPPINQPFATAKDDRKLDELRTLMNKNTFAKTDKPIITYLFDSPAWKLMRVGQKDGLQVRYLTQVFRQSDMSFVAALDRLRMGTCDDETWKLLSQCSRPLTAPIAISDNGSLSMSADIAPTPVSSELPPLPPLEEIARTLSSMYVDKHVRLKRGAQVILIKNLNVRKGLVNGSRGVITGF